jgi:hypothetical protein
MSAVTLSHSCAVCGVDISGRRRQAKTCGATCSQVLSRARRRGNCDSVLERAASRLTGEQRAWLRREVDRLTRKRLQAEAERLRDEWELAA